jgi:hypothetical protein
MRSFCGGSINKKTRLADVTLKAGESGPYRPDYFARANYSNFNNLPTMHHLSTAIIICSATLNVVLAVKLFFYRRRCKRLERQIKAALLSHAKSQ